MSAIAKVLLEMGYEVSGSDLKTSSITEHLVDMGARIFLGHAAAHVSHVDAVVISTNNSLTIIRSWWRRESKVFSFVTVRISSP